MTIPPPIPIPIPATPLASSLTVITGQQIPPIDRLRIFSATQWEDFILEWVDSLKMRYRKVERCGGAGDMGRDIVASCLDGAAEWENFQCKHYNHPLAPTDVWVEFGKLMHYTYRGDYTYPKKYYFVAPHGVGTTLSNLLKKPEALRSGLLSNWEKYCGAEISKTGAVVLDAGLKKHVETADFSIFEAVQPLEILEQHAKTRWYVARFGGGMPPRPEPPSPPAGLTSSEINYVHELLLAYGDHLKRQVNSLNELQTEASLVEHFSDCRLEFYSAEALRAFSRDTLPPGEFEKLQEEVHSGIRDEIRDEHADGYKRVLAVVKVARTLQLNSHSLNSCMAVRDRGGICHQLANDKKVKWVK